MEFWSRSWKVMEFHVGKFVSSRAAYCSGMSDMCAGKNIKLRQYVNLFIKISATARFPIAKLFYRH